MKTTLCSNPRNSLFFTFAYAAILAVVLLHAPCVCALPRSPSPPFPGSPPLYSESFDGAYSLGQTNDELVVFGVGFLDASWSGYALQRAGESVTPFVVPALDSNGHTNVSSDKGGALRFWVLPSWSSGAGTGADAVLLEMDAVSGGGAACAWSLQVSADGNMVELLSQTGRGLQEVLETPISWLAGTPHNVVLDYGPQGASLYLDGALAAQGGGVASVPLSAGQLVLGSGLSGANTAGADFDEFYSFGAGLSDADVSMYYGMIAPVAALGPISAEEQALLENGPAGFQMESIRSPGNVFDPDSDGCGCVTNGPVFLTNMLVSLDTDSNVTVSVNVQGGTNGVFYDLYTATNLPDSPFPLGWNWLAQVETCNAYVFSNQPVNAAFYVVAPPATTMFVAVGSDAAGQCDAPAVLTNAIAVAGGGDFSLALLNNGTVMGWGKNNYGQTNPPAGLSNVTAIAAGQFHAVALLASGAVTNWGCYWDGFHYCPVTNTNICILPPISNVVAVAAGIDHDIGLLSNGTVVTWGMTNANANYVPTNLTGVQAVGCGWAYNAALLTNGTVAAWGCDIFGQTNVPPGLSNVVAIAAGPQHILALLSNGTVQAWGDGFLGDTNVPAGLSNVVAIAAGGSQSLALEAVGTVVAWGTASVPIGMTATKTISCGFGHVLALRSGQTDPVITQQPSDAYSLAGGTAGFSVSVALTSGLQYQWQFEGTNITGATNAVFTITNAQSSNEGGYDVVVSSTYGVVTSSAASLALVVAPQISSSTTPAPGAIWINNAETLSVVVANDGQSEFPDSYGWQLNGANIAGATSASCTIYSLVPTNDGNYTVTVTNAAGSTNATWDVCLALPGMVETWGSDDSGECDRPAALTNVAGIAAGEYQSIAVTDSGTVAQWGQYSDGTNFYSVTNTSFVTLPPTSNVVSVAAGLGHSLALMTGQTVTNWGLTNVIANSVPISLTGVKAIACGWKFNLALLTNGNGTVNAWGDNSHGQTNVPSNLSNVIDIAAGPMHALALQANGTVVAWGCNQYGETNVPLGLSNVVAIAAGEFHSLALTSNGNVAAWGAGTSNNPSDGIDFGQSMVPAGLSNVMAVAAGDFHSVALQNDGTLVEWGDNRSGQTTIPYQQLTTVINAGTSEPPFPPTNTYPSIVPKLIAAGGKHTLVAIFSPLVSYPIDVSKDLLLIYNTNSFDSSNVCQYYLTHRPMVSGANVLGINCTTNAVIWPPDFTNLFQAQVQNWLSNNPTKRPLYVVLFQDIPQEVHWWTNNESSAGGCASVHYQLHYWTWPEWSPLVTAINMNGTSGTNNFSSDGTNDCVAYINKLTNMANRNPPGTLYISASAGGYGNTNWYFDDAGCQGYHLFGANAETGVLSVDPSASVMYAATNHIYLGTNVVGYYSGGWDCGLGGGNDSFATNGQVVFSGDSGWYIMTTIDSFSGQRVTGQAGYLTWFAANAFAGTNYSNTPVGAITCVDEPWQNEGDHEIYYGDWASGRSFAGAAWAGDGVNAFFIYLQAVGDPFVRK